MNDPRKEYDARLGLQLWFLLLLGGTIGAVSACTDDAAKKVDPDPSDSDADSDSDGDPELPPNTWYDFDEYEPGQGSCGKVILATFRDFTSDHPDFERINLGWGPLQGVLDPDLPSSKKPQMIDPWGEFQVVDSACQKECPNGGNLEGARLDSTNEWDVNWEKSNKDWESYEPPPPMYDGISSFEEWYTDVDGVNSRVQKWLSLAKENDGSYVFDSNRFFPIGEDEGMKAENNQTDADGTPHNFLFTTEVHLQFKYSGGERFTFRGDDDLWIFVNNHLALDIGGMHWPFEGTIDFDKMANELDIEEDGTYDMDIYHAERHTEASNFRIETNIDCFINVYVE
jgi:fibro-slime domain-containing protein